MATYGGDSIFGIAPNIKGIRNANAVQMNEFFGANGTQTLFGGSRGWTILVNGFFFGETIQDVVDAETYFLTYADGIARDLVDDNGRTYVQVVFDGTYETGQGGILPGVVPSIGYGYCMTYKAMFRSLV